MSDPQLDHFALSLHTGIQMRHLADSAAILGLVLRQEVTPCLIVSHDVDAPKRERFFRFVECGMLTPPGKYIGTVTSYKMLHLFEVGQ